MAFKWTNDVEDEIFRRIADGEGLITICMDDWLPSRETVRRRLADDEAFRGKYADARAMQGDTHFERVCGIVDKVERGELEPQQARTMIDALKWTAGKLRPKVYGDKIDLSGNVGLTVTLESDADKL